MYKLLASHVYPEGQIYSGPATECYYSFYVSKDFHPDDVATNVIEQSEVGATEQGATMLATDAWVDEGGANNLYSVRFAAIGPSLTSGEISSIGILGWIIALIIVAIIAFTVVYTVNVVRDISYSPSGPGMWEGLKWLAISGIVIAGAILLSKFLPTVKTK